MLVVTIFCYFCESMLLSVVVCVNFMLLNSLHLTNGRNKRDFTYATAYGLVTDWTVKEICTKACSKEVYTKQWTGAWYKKTAEKDALCECTCCDCAVSVGEKIPSVCNGK